HPPPPLTCRAPPRIGDLGRIRHRAHSDALGERRQALELRFSDDGKRHQDVGDAAIRHDLGFTELLAGDADRAELDLAAREFDDLMRLNVRTKRDLLFGEIIRSTLEIALDPVEVDDRGGRVDIVDAHRAHFAPISFSSRVSARSNRLNISSISPSVMMRGGQKAITSPMPRMTKPSS